MIAFAGFIQFSASNAPDWRLQWPDPEPGRGWPLSDLFVLSDPDPGLEEEEGLGGTQPGHQQVDWGTAAPCSQVGDRDKFSIV